jgi:CIC family chloride channel protein
MLRPFNSVQRPALLLTWLQRRARSSETVFILAAIAVGAIAGLLSVVQGGLARTLQHFLFRLPPDEHLSSTATLGLMALIALPLGGAALSLFSWAVAARKRRLVDAVEANALHGGRMSLSDSLIVSGQTIISNGFGASVGLEAAYAQMGAVAGSMAGIRLRLRRGDLRNLVGAGTAGAIAAAFGAPLAGAFYAFEIVIGAYTPAAIAPIAAAALSGAFVAQLIGARPYLIDAVAGAPTETHHFLIYAALGAVCALMGIALMRAVAVVEAATKRLIKREWLRPALGGVLLIPIALLSPQALSAGHGALYLDLETGLPLAFLGTILIAKAAGSIVSLGFGFRGGLFFASLFLGSLIGHLFAGALAQIFGTPVIDPRNAALVGMAAFSVAVIGGPMTMAMLVLQATNDFALTGAVIAASLVASTIVRDLFGYSFSTWRLHLRGEAVKSARDVGWVKTLTAGSMMRRETRATPASISVADFRRRFPLGSTSRVVLIDDDERYAGIANPASAFAEGVAGDAIIGTLATARDHVLPPEASIRDVMTAFDAFGGDELAVVDAQGVVLGLLSESYVQRRYAEEVDKAQRELFGET